MHQNKKALQMQGLRCLEVCSPSWARTKDPLINSQML